MFMDKDLEYKIQDDLRLDQECYSKTEVEISGKWPVSIASAFGHLRDCILVSDQL